MERNPGVQIVPDVTLPDQWNELTSDPLGGSHGDPTAFFIEHLDTAIVDAKNLLIKSGFNVSVDDLSTHHLAGGDVAMVATGMIKAKEKNIDLSFDQACALDLQDKYK